MTPSGNNLHTLKGLYIARKHWKLFLIRNVCITADALKNYFTEGRLFLFKLTAVSERFSAINVTRFLACSGRVQFVSFNSVLTGNFIDDNLRSYLAVQAHLYIVLNISATVKCRQKLT